MLNALAGELTDAGLRLLAPGGLFLEMGKTDLRDPGQVAAGHPGVAYRPFDLSEAGPGRLAEILAEVTGLLAAGVLALPPVRAWDARRAAKAMRFMSQARHVGKLVLTIPSDQAAPRPAGTALITGGTGTLGGLVARHLAVTGRAAAVILASRSGPAASGVPALAASIAAAGATVQVTACDVADRGHLAAVIAWAPAGSPLTQVIHAAGVIDDATVGSLTEERMAAVLRPKAEAAWHLHRLTEDMDLEHFVLFSSAAAVFGSPGQGSYAAANAFLDALAEHRRARGLPATSVAWGLWADASGMTGHLTDAQRARLSLGAAPLSASGGLALMDQATARDEAVVVAANLDLAALRAHAARGGDLPPIWRTLIGPAAPRAAAAVSSPAAARAAGRAARRPAGAAAAQPGPRARRRGTGSPGPGSGRPRAPLPGAGVRLADSPGAQEPAERGHGPRAFRFGGLRPPHARAAG